MRFETDNLSTEQIPSRSRIRRVGGNARQMAVIAPLPVDCGTCAARGNGLCAELTDCELAKVRHARSGDKLVPAGSDVFALGTHCQTIYNLVDGWAFRYSIMEDGQRQILDFVLPGAVLGFCTAKNSVSTYGVQALTNATLCAIPRETFTALLRNMPELGIRLAWLIARDRNLAYDRLSSIGKLSAREQVAHLILELFTRCHAQWPGHDINEMYLPLTQEHVGDAVGMTGVHVNRVLRELREEGILEFHYRRLRVLNIDRLVDVAKIDPHLAVQWSAKPRKISTLSHLNLAAQDMVL